MTLQAFPMSSQQQRVGVPEFWEDTDIDTTTHFASPVQVCGTIIFWNAPGSPIGAKGGLRIQPVDMP